MTNDANNDYRRRRLDPAETRIVDLDGVEAQQADPYRPVEAQRSGYIPRVTRPEQPPAVPFEDVPTRAGPARHEGPPPRIPSWAQPGAAQQRPVTGAEQPFAQPVPQRGVAAQRVA